MFVSTSLRISEYICREVGIQHLAMADYLRFRAMNLVQGELPASNNNTHIPHCQMRPSADYGK